LRRNPLSLYNETVLDHYQTPRNVGALEAADAVGIAENSACGDVLHLYLQIGASGHITAATFKTFGCAAAIAAGSMLTEMVKGSSLEEIRLLTKQDVVDALGGLPPMKVHCSVLAEDAIKAAIEDFSSRTSESRTS
jgi:nitrogen fixation NifU-like protein